jgi:hypothetical protein
VFKVERTTDVRIFYFAVFDWQVAVYCRHCRYELLFIVDTVGTRFRSVAIKLECFI